MSHDIIKKLKDVICTVAHTNMIYTSPPWHFAWSYHFQTPLFNMLIFTTTFNSIPYLADYTQDISFNNSVGWTIHTLCGPLQNNPSKCTYTSQNSKLITVICSLLFLQWVLLLPRLLLLLDHFWDSMSAVPTS